MNLHQWAIRHGISHVALADLRREMGLDGADPTSVHTGVSEASVSASVRLEASRKGMRLFRNNVGAAKTDTGSYVRFGLANDSEAVNKIIKSADLIGIKPVVITPGMIGRTIGQFLSREVKESSWRYSGTDREEAQLRWVELITSLGGDAAFATSVGSL